MTAADAGQLRDELARFGAAIPPEERRDARNVIGRLFRALEHGEVRAAERDGDGRWQVQRWVKDGILLAFRLGRLVEAGEAGPFTFVDKDLLAVDTIQRCLLRQQGKPKAAVSMAHAVRSAIHSYAAQLRAKAYRHTSPLVNK